MEKYEGMPRRHLSVGEVAARSGLAVSTLHFYERKGLIKSWRTAGNQRRYPRDVLRRLGIIRVAQNMGIPLAQIRAGTGCAARWAHPRCERLGAAVGPLARGS